MYVPGDGPTGQYMLIGEAPGFEEQQAGENFVGRSGRELWSALKRHANLDRKQFYVTNLVKEGLPKNRDPKYHEVVKWMPELLEELERVKPKMVVTAGGFSTRFFLDRNITDTHGILHEITFMGKPLRVFPIYHPAAGLHNKAFLSAFGYDCTQLGNVFRNNEQPWELDDKPYSVSWLEHLEQIDEYQATNAVVGIDTEGWKHKPWGLSFSIDGEHAYVIRADQSNVLRWFAAWIRRQRPVGHNLLHDIPVFRAMGIELPDRFDDTMVLAYHDMLRTGSGVLEATAQNLGTLAYRKLGLILRELPELEGVDFGTETIPYTSDVRDYAGRDALATRRLRDCFSPLVDDPIYLLDRGALRYVEQMITNGLPFDVDSISELYGDVLANLAHTTIALKTMAAKRGNRDFNPGSHPQVRELVTRKFGLRVRKRTKGGKASTNEKALSEHKDHPFVKAIGDYREQQKLKGTYIEPLLRELLNG